MDKKLTEMNNKELFSALAGDNGVMAEMFVKDAANSYKKKNDGKLSDLKTMVDDYADESSTDNAEKKD